MLFVCLFVFLFACLLFVVVIVVVVFVYVLLMFVVLNHFNRCISVINYHKKRTNQQKRQRIYLKKYQNIRELEDLIDMIHDMYDFIYLFFFNFYIYFILFIFVQRIFVCFQSQYNLLQNKLRKEFENALSRYHAIQNVSTFWIGTNI